LASCLTHGQRIFERTRCCTFGPSCRPLAGSNRYGKRGPLRVGSASWRPHQADVEL